MTDDNKYIVKLVIYCLPPQDRGFSLRAYALYSDYTVWKIGPFRIEWWHWKSKADKWTKGVT